METEVKEKKITETKKSKPKYFTDEDAKNIFVFQESYKFNSNSGKPTQKSVTLKFRKR
jgi:hypothetical protein